MFQVSSWLYVGIITGIFLAGYNVCLKLTSGQLPAPLIVLLIGVPYLSVGLVWVLIAKPEIAFNNQLLYGVTLALLTGLCAALAEVFFVKAYTEYNAPLSLFPIFVEVFVSLTVVLTGWLLLTEQLTIIRLAGIVFCLVGAALLALSGHE